MVKVSVLLGDDGWILFRQVSKENLSGPAIIGHWTFHESIIPTHRLSMIQPVEAFNTYDHR